MSPAYSQVVNSDSGSRLYGTSLHYSCNFPVSLKLDKNIFPPKSDGWGAMGVDEFSEIV